MTTAVRLDAEIRAANAAGDGAAAALLAAVQNYADTGASGSGRGALRLAAGEVRRALVAYDRMHDGAVQLEDQPSDDPSLEAGRQHGAELSRQFRGSVRQAPEPESDPWQEAIRQTAQRLNAQRGWRAPEAP